MPRKAERLTNYNTMKTIFQTLLLIMLPLSLIGAAEFRPVGIWSDGDVFSPEFSIEKMIDENLSTHVCLLDDTRDGYRVDTVPVHASYPVTAEFVLDLGEMKSCVGIRFVSPQD